MQVFAFCAFLESGELAGLAIFDETRLVLITCPVGFEFHVIAKLTLGFVQRMQTVWEGGFLTLVFF
jgi:hypothetical protein